MWSRVANYKQTRNLQLQSKITIFWTRGSIKTQEFLILLITTGRKGTYFLSEIHYKYLYIYFISTPTTLNTYLFTPCTGGSQP